MLCHGGHVSELSIELLTAQPAARRTRAPAQGIRHHHTIPARKAQWRPSTSQSTTPVLPQMVLANQLRVRLKYRWVLKWQSTLRCVSVIPNEPGHRGRVRFGVAKLVVMLAMPQFLSCSSSHTAAEAQLEFHRLRGAPCSALVCAHPQQPHTANATAPPFGPICARLLCSLAGVNKTNNATHTHVRWKCQAQRSPTSSRLLSRPAAAAITPPGYKQDNIFRQVPAMGRKQRLQP